MNGKYIKERDNRELDMYAPNKERGFLSYSAALHHTLIHSTKQTLTHTINYTHNLLIVYRPATMIDTAEHVCCENTFAMFMFVRQFNGYSMIWNLFNNIITF